MVTTSFRDVLLSQLKKSIKSQAGTLAEKCLGKTSVGRWVYVEFTVSFAFFIGPPCPPGLQQSVCSRSELAVP